ncbi:DUF4156 domain-containing protein [Labilithrix luteola]|nr:DUF4156 domain-containing protein [Labilithrix luteola]
MRPRLNVSFGSLSLVLVSLASLASLVTVAGCSTSALSPKGAQVAATRNPPTRDCAALKYIVGQGGGTFGGAYISNDDLVEYAMNDLRNKAADLGANYVQHDPPQLGSGSGTTTTVTISGTAYRCSGAPTNAAKL